MAAALDAGCRRFVIATTGWALDRDRVETLLASHGAAAVAASNFSLGVVLFGRLSKPRRSCSGRWTASIRTSSSGIAAAKRDRPSGTATDLARRIVAGHPRLATADDLEVVSIRAGASPGMHLVGFDAAGETVELRLTARDRSAYAAGILAAADWLRPRAARRPASTPSTPSSTSSSLATRSPPERTLR